MPILTLLDSHFPILSFSHCSICSSPPTLLPQLQVINEREKLSEKYPAFELVLSFVRNDSLSAEKVHTILEQKSVQARTVSQVYSFAAEFVRSIGVGLFEVSLVSFLLESWSCFAALLVILRIGRSYEAEINTILILFRCPFR